MSNFECIIWKVEHGSAAFLRTPNDRTIMFDAGCSDDFSPGQHLRKNYGLNKNDKRLDKIIISHPDNDHIADLPEIYNFIYPKILSRNKTIPTHITYPSGKNNLQEPLKTYKRMDEEYCCEASDYNKSQPISNWGNVFIKTFYCEPKHIPECPESKIKNNLSLLSYVRYLDTEIVFPGDLEPYGWQAILENTNLEDYAGKAKCRILVASHHGRESGIRFDYKGKKYIYDEFLKLMNPHLIIISDKRGNETTDPEAYRPYAEGFPVIDKFREIKTKQIITTKTNQYIFISVFGKNTTPSINVP